MKHKAISFILDIVMLASIGTLALFLIAEIVLEQDVFFAYHLIVIAIASISIMLLYWYKDRHIAFKPRTTPLSKTDALFYDNNCRRSRFHPVSCALITCGP